MTDEEIKAKRKALSDKAAALKELQEIGEISYDEYSQQIAKIQIERRKLKNLNLIDVGDEIIDVEIVSVETDTNDSDGRQQVDPSKPDLSTREQPRKIGALVRLPVFRDMDGDGQRERDWSNSPVPERRCRAHRKNGEQCKNASVLGSTICRYHGGAAKHVKQAARARLENATDMMAKALLGMAIDPNVSDAVKLSAIKDALDRGGLKAPSEVVLSPGQQAGFEEIFDDIATGSRIESRRARGIDDSDETGGQHDSYPFDLAVPQRNSPTAPAMPNSGSDTPPAYRGSDPPASPYEHAEQRRDRSPRSHPREPSAATTGPFVVTGEDAIRLANEANAAIGALRALPPGRSG
jgi:hypothetical protein